MGERADSPETHLGSWAGADASPRSPFYFPGELLKAVASLLAAGKLRVGAVAGG